MSRVFNLSDPILAVYAWACSHLASAQGRPTGSSLAALCAGQLGVTLPWDLFYGFPPRSLSALALQGASLEAAGLSNAIITVRN